MRRRPSTDAARVPTLRRALAWVIGLLALIALVGSMSTTVVVSYDEQGVALTTTTTLDGGYDYAANLTVQAELTPGLSVPVERPVVDSSGNFFASSAEPLAPGSAAGSGGDELTTVGRWMSPDEYDAMLNTRQVQVGGGGTTSVAHPANPEAFMPQAAPGSYYVEFDVPSGSVFPGGRADWGQIPSPNHILARLAEKRGTPLSWPVAACNIVHLATRLGGGSC